MTEVTDGKLTEGMDVILSEMTSVAGNGTHGSSETPATNSNPFVPQMPGRRR